MGYARPGSALDGFRDRSDCAWPVARRHFTYLSVTARPQARVVLGDARIANWAGPAPPSFDLLAIDAFSSDSIPLHLFTHEAFGVYLDALSPRGILLVHISNRYIELEPALMAEVAARGLHAAVRDDAPPAGGP
jgi:spermidine synthase